MIQPSLATLPQSDADAHPLDNEPFEDLEPIALSPVTRERLRVLNRVLNSALTGSEFGSTNLDQPQQLVLTTINE